jgi:cholesterol transport system auxiliary component
MSAGVSRAGRAAGWALVVALAGCGSLLGPQQAPPHRFSLDGAAAGAPSATTPAAPSASAPVLVVTPLTASAGFATDRMIYLRRAQEPEPYADNAWVEPPAHMLAPLIVESLQRSGAFAAVTATPTSAMGQVRLDAEVVRLQHELFGGPGRVRFTLRVTLVDKRGPQQRVLVRELDASAPTPSDDASGAAQAAQAAVRDVLGQLATFCAASVGGTGAGS